MAAATRRFGGVSDSAVRQIRRHRKARAWGVEWARARDANLWRSSSVNLKGHAKGTGMGALLPGSMAKKQGRHRSMPANFSLCPAKTLTRDLRNGHLARQPLIGS